MNETGSSQHISAEAVPLDAPASSREGRGMTDPVERVARAIHPGAFQEDERLRHQYCSPLAVERVQAYAKETARAAIAAMPGEPVAYRWRWADAPTDAWNASTVNPDQLGKIVEPLYAAPAMPATDAVREALEHVTELLVDTWGTAMEGDAEREIAVSNARAALSHPSQGGWQPIETAPKDGTHILAITMEYWKPVNGNHRWVHSRVVETYWVGIIGCFAMGERKQPTHWLPMPGLPALPAPPEVQP